MNVMYLPMRRCLFLSSLAVLSLWAMGTEPSSAQNIRPAAILSQLDIDEDGFPDAAVDSDGDGLPDNWEIGGVESPGADGRVPDRLVRFSAPTGIGPGTPPTFLTGRLSVATSADKWDTDDDGLSDFIEVFGLKFIDDNGNGVLDFIFDDKNGNGVFDFVYTDANGNGRWDPGEEHETIDPSSEWMDLNMDGLPSIGEFPLKNRLEIHDKDGNVIGQSDNDFDGFMFTDPTLADTDGDGIPDGADRDPLINPQTFGLLVGSEGFRRRHAPDDDLDLDNDGLGNGSDFGNDLRTSRHVDFPIDMVRFIRLFRPGLLQDETGAAIPNPRVPESLIEDLLGVDWNGDGLYRITDTRDFAIQVDPNDSDLVNLLTVGGRSLYSSQNPTAVAHFGSVPDGLTAPTFPYGERGVGMGLQNLLLPPGTSELFPDRRVWTILYAWRMPGFDIDGDGFVGPPSGASECVNFGCDDRHEILVTNFPDGWIEAPAWCGQMGMFGMLMAVCGVAVAGLVAPRRRASRRSAG